MTFHTGRRHRIPILLIIPIITLGALILQRPRTTATRGMAFITRHCVIHLKPPLWTLIRTPLTVCLRITGDHTVSIALTLYTELFTWSEALITGFFAAVAAVFFVEITGVA